MDVDCGTGASSLSRQPCCRQRPADFPRFESLLVVYCADFEKRQRICNAHAPQEDSATMNRSIVMRRILLAPPSLRRSIFSLGTIHLRVEKPKAYATLSVTQPSFWTSLIPKPLRKGSSLKSSAKSAKPKEWNPATFFIFIFLLIGSMSVQMIALRNEFAAFSRRADAKIGLLKEIIGRIQNGEEVDVEGLLGTGDARREKEWEEGMWHVS
jgi:hypothetical protein